MIPVLHAIVIIIKSTLVLRHIRRSLAHGLKIGCSIHTALEGIKMGGLRDCTAAAMGCFRCYSLATTGSTDTLQFLANDCTNLMTIHFTGACPLIGIEVQIIKDNTAYHYGCQCDSYNSNVPRIIVICPYERRLCTRYLTL